MTYKNKLEKNERTKGMLKCRMLERDKYRKGKETMSFMNESRAQSVRMREDDRREHNLTANKKEERRDGNDCEGRKRND